MSSAKAIRQYYDQQLEALIIAAIRAGAEAAALKTEDLRPGDWIRCTVLKLDGVELGRVVVKREDKTITVRTITEPVQ
jgi:hypothetical protein